MKSKFHLPTLFLVLLVLVGLFASSGVASAQNPTSRQIPFYGVSTLLADEQPAAIVVEMTASAPRPTRRLEPHVQE